MNKTRKYKKPLTLNDIIVELEQNDEEEVPDSIIIMPPENCNAEVTDEDSGDEDVVLLQNLPGWQLRAPAEIQREDSSDYSDNDDLPLSEHRAVQN
ncbi:piggyBac transposable element-derived protein 3-like [Pectinophora gossypiella]|uniref:piggyBac transposable element-derived protein 3-like n=1 Tax=Pectinophora gossypiella TaxID=13191 RepID=UPI00214E115E|nr:piggyBac transposable element-derived protein 3-like [Pectinophora gossypiella]